MTLWGQSVGQGVGAQTAGSDSLADGSPVADSAGQTIRALGEGVTSAGRLIAEGQWEALGQRILNGAAGMVASFLPKAISALFVVAVFYAAYRIALTLVQRILRRSSRVGAGMEAVLTRTLRVVGLAFVAIMGLSQLGLNVSALIAGLGIAGLAVGFAAKDSLENFISGVTILLDRPFRVGDWVTVGDTYGRVTELTLRSTRIRTLNREEVVFPNVFMVTEAVTNHSSQSTLRVDVPFGVAYKEDLDRTREVVLELPGGDERIASSPEPRVVVTELGDSSVNMELHLHLMDPGEAVPVRFEYVEKVRKALAAADIEIPFPHLQLFVDGADGLRGLQLVADARDPSSNGSDRDDGAGEDEADSASGDGGREEHHGDREADGEVEGSEAAPDQRRSGNAASSQGSPGE